MLHHLLWQHFQQLNYFFYQQNQANLFALFIELIVY
jgi:hypothetical protein